MSIYALGDKRPVIGEGAYVAPGARLIGDVRLGAGASVWFNAVIRADSEPIVIGEGANVQDGCVFHVDPGFPLTLGPNVTVGHGAILHGCTVGEGALIGMGAIVLNGASVGAGALVGAHALVPEGREIEAGMMALGAPAKAVKALSEEQRAGLLATAGVYHRRSAEYASDLTPLD